MGSSIVAWKGRILSSGITLLIHRDRLAPAVFAAAGRRWLLVPPWSLGSSKVRRLTLDPPTSQQNGSASLAPGIANLINLFTPDAIVLGGSVMKSADIFLAGIRKVISQGCRFVPFEKTELALASLGDDVNLIGAARAWHHRFGQPSEA